MPSSVVCVLSFFFFCVYVYTNKSGLNPPPSPSDALLAPFLHCSTVFLQRRDASRARGYFQHALVAVSASEAALPVLRALAQAAAPHVFEAAAAGESVATVLEAVCHSVAGWPARPPAGSPGMELPVSGDVIRVALAPERTGWVRGLPCPVGFFFFFFFFCRSRLIGSSNL
jgi:hypothetical protein